MDNLTDKGTSVNSHSSRIGIKGSEDLGSGLKAVYKMEFGVDMTEKSGLGGRNAYVGLAGGFGTVLMGRHDTPFKMSQGKDLFNDATKSGYGDNQPMAGKLGVSSGEVRAEKVVAYVSPSFGGVKIIAAGVSGDNNSNAGSGYGVAAKDAALTNAYSVAATYGSKKKGLYLAGAYNNWDSKMAGVTNGVDDIKETRFVAQYKSNSGLLANVMFQDFDTSVIATEGTNIQANIGYNMGKIMPKFKYSTVDYKSSTMNDGDAFAVGIDYSLGKKTTAKLDYVTYDKNLAANGGPNGKSTSLVSVGLLHKF